ncbi:MAG: 50S ribosomal protein L3 [Vulcanimicrobiota bacterium]
MQEIIGRKIGMTQIYDESGSLVPVTVVEAGPCPVVQRKTTANDGYEAVQLGFDEMKKSAEELENSKRGGWKPRVGHLRKHGLDVVVRELIEVRVDDASAVAEVVKVDIFEEGQKVDVSGVSKGKGFAGVMKRHNFAGNRASHGVSKIHRMPNSNGSVDAARVFKGKKLPGQMGNKNVTTLGLSIAKVDAERNLLLIKGAVPGSKGSLVVVRKSVKG